MRASSACLALIKTSEGCRLTAYRDQAGILTIGWGHTGPEVTDGLTISQGWADQMLLADVARAEGAVESLASGLELTQGQFDALVDFVFNLGASALAGSTLLVKLRMGNLDAAAAEFIRWDKIHTPDGVAVSAPLYRRRLAERRMFLQGGAA